MNHGTRTGTPVNGLGYPAEAAAGGIHVAYGKYVHAGSVFEPHLKTDLGKAEQIAKVVLGKLKAGG